VFFSTLQPHLSQPPLRARRSQQYPLPQHTATAQASTLQLASHPSSRLPERLPPLDFAAAGEKSNPERHRQSMSLSQQPARRLTTPAAQAAEVSQRLRTCRTPEARGVGTTTTPDQMARERTPPRMGGAVHRSRGRQPRCSQRAAQQLPRGAPAARRAGRPGLQPETGSQAAISAPRDEEEEEEEGGGGGCSSRRGCARRPPRARGDEDKAFRRKPRGRPPKAKAAKKKREAPASSSSSAAAAAPAGSKRKRGGREAEMLREAALDDDEEAGSFSPGEGGGARGRIAARADPPHPPPRAPPPLAQARTTEARGGACRCTRAARGPSAGAQRRAWGGGVPRAHTPAPAARPCRGMRRRWNPLDHWKGERIFYRQDEVTGAPSAVVAERRRHRDARRDPAVRSALQRPYPEAPPPRTAPPPPSCAAGRRAAAGGRQRRAVPAAGRGGLGRVRAPRGGPSKGKGKQQQHSRQSAAARESSGGLSSAWRSESARLGATAGRRAGEGRGRGGQAQCRAARA